MLRFVLPTENDRDAVLSFYNEVGENGGVLENTLYDPDENVTVKRYWIGL